VADLRDGETAEMKGSGAKPYVLKNTGGVYSCSCPAWRNQGVAIERRTCKHLKKLRGDAVEAERVGGPVQSVTEEPAEPTKAPPILLAHSWDGVLDPTRWWMSEKLDGLRAYWNGQRFISRLGNTYHAPEWFVTGLPSTPLDGELWAGRKKFQRATSIARRQDKSDLWKELQFVVFDAPSLPTSFEDRICRLDDLLASGRPKYACAHDYTRCESVGHLRRELERIEGLGGEGLMLREPGSLYEVGRSATMLKVKSFKDEEAEVIGHLPGTGRHKGSLGALDVVLKNGTRFSIGTGFTDAERREPPPVGAIVTFKYQELSDGGVPRFPSFVRIREENV
jgi:DNA ligase-1